MFLTVMYWADACCREAVRRMSIERGGSGGSIVNLGSVAARLGSPGERVHYAGQRVPW